MRTFLSAVSLVLVCLVPGHTQQKLLSLAESAVHEKLQGSVAVLAKSTKTQGMAVLIDNGGFFLAHRLSIKSGATTATMPNGRSLVLRLVQQDEPSQMVLLKADDWSPSYGAPVKLAREAVQPGDRVLAILPSGIARAEIANTNLFGVISDNRRLIPLFEIRLEAPADQIGGAAVFTLEGNLIGIIGAALKQPDPYNTTSQQRVGFGNSGGVARARSGATELKGLNRFSKPFGPTALTVAYVAGQNIMERVVHGFASPTREVEHPTLGVFCRDSARGGALIDYITPNSPADKASLKVGDIIFELAGLPIRNQLDFAKAMMNQSVGQRVVVKVIRNKDLLNLTVTIGK